VPSKDSVLVLNKILATPGFRERSWDAYMIESSERFILETKNLSKKFGGISAIDDLTLNFCGGELRCIIGPNGAGKSTLFNLITGHIRPSSGLVIFNGINITNKAPNRICRLGIGRKFQVPTVFPTLTVTENLMLALQGKRNVLGFFFNSYSADLLEIEKVLLDIGLMTKRSLTADTLSHGERQWLEIGMVLVNKPMLILLDEPTAGMSPEETLGTARLIRKVSQNVTIVVIEHDLKFIREIGQHVTVLHRGRKLAEGSMEEIIKNDDVKRVYLGRETDPADLLCS
jgi:urea transport system ATP-binding protein